MPWNTQEDRKKASDVAVSAMLTGGIGALAFSMYPKIKTSHFPGGVGSLLDSARKKWGYTAQNELHSLIEESTAGKESYMEEKRFMDQIVKEAELFRATTSAVQTTESITEIRARISDRINKLIKYTDETNAVLDTLKMTSSFSKGQIVRLRSEIHTQIGKAIREASLIAREYAKEDSRKAFQGTVDALQKAMEAREAEVRGASFSDEAKVFAIEKASFTRENIAGTKGILNTFAEEFASPVASALEEDSLNRLDKRLAQIERMISNVGKSSSAIITAFGNKQEERRETTRLWKQLHKSSQTLSKTERYSIHNTIQELVSPTISAEGEVEVVQQISHHTTGPAIGETHLTHNSLLNSIKTELRAHTFSGFNDNLSNVAAAEKTTGAISKIITNIQRANNMIVQGGGSPTNLTYKIVDTGTMTEVSNGMRGRSLIVTLHNEKFGTINLPPIVLDQGGVFKSGMHTAPSIGRGTLDFLNPKSIDPMNITEQTARYALNLRNCLSLLQNLQNPDRMRAQQGMRQIWDTMKEIEEFSHAAVFTGGFELSHRSSASLVNYRAHTFLAGRDVSFISREMRELQDSIQHMMSTHSLLKDKNNLASLDIETTGIRHGRDKILSIASWKMENGVRKSYEVYVQVSSHIIDNMSDDLVLKLANKENIKDLTPAKARVILKTRARKGIPIEDAIKGLKEFIGDRNIAAHNARFDIDFLKHESGGSFDIAQHKIIDNMHYARYRSILHNFGVIRQEDMINNIWIEDGKYVDVNSARLGMRGQSISTLAKETMESPGNSRDFHRKFSAVEGIGGTSSGAYAHNAGYDALSALFITEYNAGWLDTNEIKSMGILYDSIKAQLGNKPVFDLLDKNRETQAFLDSIYGKTDEYDPSNLAWSPTLSSSQIVQGFMNKVNSLAYFPFAKLNSVDRSPHQRAFIADILKWENKTYVRRIRTRIWSHHLKDWIGGETSTVDLNMEVNPYIHHSLQTKLMRRYMNNTVAFGGKQNVPAIMSVQTAVWNGAETIENSDIFDREFFRRQALPIIGQEKTTGFMFTTPKGVSYKNSETYKSLPKNIKRLIGGWEIPDLHSSVISFGSDAMKQIERMSGSRFETDIVVLQAAVIEDTATGNHELRLRYIEKMNIDHGQRAFSDVSKGTMIDARTAAEMPLLFNSFGNGTPVHVVSMNEATKKGLYGAGHAVTLARISDRLNIQIQAILKKLETETNSSIKSTLELELRQRVELAAELCDTLDADMTLINGVEGGRYTAKVFEKHGRNIDTIVNYLKKNGFKTHFAVDLVSKESGSMEETINQEIDRTRLETMNLHGFMGKYAKELDVEISNDFYNKAIDWFHKDLKDIGMTREEVSKLLQNQYKKYVTMMFKGTVNEDLLDSILNPIEFAPNKVLWAIPMKVNRRYVGGKLVLDINFNPTNTPMLRNLAADNAASAKRIHHYNETKRQGLRNSEGWKWDVYTQRNMIDFISGMKQLGEERKDYDLLERAKTLEQVMVYMESFRPKQSMGFNNLFEEFMKQSRDSAIHEMNPTQLLKLAKDLSMGTVTLDNIPQIEKIALRKATREYVNRNRIGTAVAELKNLDDVLDTFQHAGKNISPEEAISIREQISEEIGTPQIKRVSQAKYIIDDLKGTIFDSNTDVGKTGFVWQLNEDLWKRRLLPGLDPDKKKEVEKLIKRTTHVPVLGTKFDPNMRMGTDLVLMKDYRVAVLNLAIVEKAMALKESGQTDLLDAILTERGWENNSIELVAERALNTIHDTIDEMYSKNGMVDEMFRSVRVPGGRFLPAKSQNPVANALYWAPESTTAKYQAAPGEIVISSDIIDRMDEAQRGRISAGLDALGYNKDEIKSIMRGDIADPQYRQIMDDWATGKRQQPIAMFGKQPIQGTPNQQIWARRFRVVNSGTKNGKMFIVGTHEFDRKFMAAMDFDSDRIDLHLVGFSKGTNTTDFRNFVNSLENMVRQDVGEGGTLWTMASKIEKFVSGEGTPMEGMLYVPGQGVEVDFNHKLKIEQPTPGATKRMLYVLNNGTLGLKEDRIREQLQSNDLRIKGYAEKGKVMLNSQAVYVKTTDMNTSVDNVVALLNRDHDLVKLGIQADASDIFKGLEENKEKSMEAIKTWYGLLNAKKMMRSYKAQISSAAGVKLAPANAFYLAAQMVAGAEALDKSTKGGGHAARVLMGMYPLIQSGISAKKGSRILELLDEATTTLLNIDKPENVEKLRKGIYKAHFESVKDMAMDFEETARLVDIDKPEIRGFEQIVELEDAEMRRTRLDEWTKSIVENAGDDKQKLQNIEAFKTRVLDFSKEVHNNKLIFTSKRFDQSLQKNTVEEIMDSLTKTVQYMRETSRITGLKKLNPDLAYRLLHGTAGGARVMAKIYDMAERGGVPGEMMSALMRLNNLADDQISSMSEYESRYFGLKEKVRPRYSPEYLASHRSFTSRLEEWIDTGRYKKGLDGKGGMLLGAGIGAAALLTYFNSNPATNLGAIPGRGGEYWDHRRKHADWMQLPEHVPIDIPEYDFNKRVRVEPRLKVLERLEQSRARAHAELLYDTYTYGGRTPRGKSYSPVTISDRRWQDPSYFDKIKNNLLITGEPNEYNR